MSLFGSIFRSVGNWIGEKVENFGANIGNYKIMQVGRNIQDACSEKVSSERSYEKETSNISSTERLNEILVSFSEGYYQQATALEKACISDVENYYDAIIDILEGASEQIRMDTNLKRIKRAKSNIVKRIDGAVKNPLAKRMSLDDSECLRILKLDAGEEKRRQMSVFSQKVINEALLNLSKQVRESLDEQMGWIEDYIVNLSEEQEREFTVLKNQYTKMMETGDDENYLQEQNCMNPLITFQIAEIVEKILL